MATPNLQAVKRRVESATGLGFHVAGQTGPDGFSASVRPLGFERLHGFAVEVSLGYRSVSARFAPDTFAGDVVGLMAASPPEQRSEFCALAREVHSKGSVLLELDGRLADAAESTLWPERWDVLRLEMEWGPLELDSSTVDAVVAEAALAITSLVLTLLPLEILELDQVFLGQEEGAEYRTTGRGYERSPANRAACIALKGSKCAACGLDMAARYGHLGEGYIHVHHGTPVSQMGPDYVVDIEKDLFPLCPNCHSMVHKESPPVTIEALVGVLRRLSNDR